MQSDYIDVIYLDYLSNLIVRKINDARIQIFCWRKIGKNIWTIWITNDWKYISNHILIICVIMLDPYFESIFILCTLKG